MAYTAGPVAQYAQAGSRLTAQSLRSCASLASLVDFAHLGNPLRRCSTLHAAVYVESICGRVPVELSMQSSTGHQIPVGCEVRRPTLGELARRYNLTVKQVRTLISEAESLIDEELRA